MSLKSTDITRRSFLSGAGAVGAVAAMGALAGCAPTNPTQGAANEPMAETGEAVAGDKAAGAWDAQPDSVADQVAATEDHEVVVVGAGNSGIVCALEVAQLGGEVLVLEQSGAATMWAGDIDACDSKIMKDAGENVDKEFIIHDLVRYASGKCDENLIRLWAYNSGAFVDWY